MTRRIAAALALVLTMALAACSQPMSSPDNTYNQYIILDEDKEHDGVAAYSFVSFTQDGKSYGIDHNGQCFDSQGEIRCPSGIRVEFLHSMTDPATKVLFDTRLVTITGAQ